MYSVGSQTLLLQWSPSGWQPCVLCVWMLVNEVLLLCTFFPLSIECVSNKASQLLGNLTAFQMKKCKLIYLCVASFCKALGHEMTWQSKVFGLTIVQPSLCLKQSISSSSVWDQWQIWRMGNAVLLRAPSFISNGSSDWEISYSVAFDDAFGLLVQWFFL